MLTLSTHRVTHSGCSDRLVGDVRAERPDLRVSPRGARSYPVPDTRTHAPGMAYLIAKRGFLLNLAAGGTRVTGGAPLFVRGSGEDHVPPADSAAVLALQRTDPDRHPQRSR